MVLVLVRFSPFLSACSLNGAHVINALAPVTDVGEISPGNGYWRQQCDHVLTKLKAFSRDTPKFQLQVCGRVFGFLLGGTLAVAVPWLCAVCCLRRSRVLTDCIFGGSAKCRWGSTAWARSPGPRSDRYEEEKKGENSAFWFQPHLPGLPGYTGGVFFILTNACCAWLALHRLALRRRTATRSC